MSIATRTGDLGTTSLMYGRRVPKTDPHVVTYGAIDELNAALGMARATAKGSEIATCIMDTQRELVLLMGELACAPEDLRRYYKSKYPTLSKRHLNRLDRWITHMEKDKGLSFSGWATPGSTLHAAALDMARTICRRAERELVHLTLTFHTVRPIMIQYLNRLSDLLWLMARWEESNLPEPPKPYNPRKKTAKKGISH